MLLGVSTHALSYWTKRFTGLGLLHVTGTVKRGGRAVKHYATAQDGFFVPFAAVPDSSLETLLHQQEEPWQRLLAHSLVQVGSDTFPDLHRWGMAVYQEGDVLYTDVTPTPEDGRTLNEIALEPASPALLMDWYTFSLTFQDAKAFQRELYALIQKYGQKRGPQSYLARITLAPLTSDSPSEV